MSQPVDAVSSELSRLREINDRCNRFEAAWKAGNRPRIEAFVDLEDSDRTLLRHLILLELDYRRQRGEEPRIDEYLDRFPHLGKIWLEVAIADSARSEISQSRTLPGLQAGEFLDRIVRVGLISEQEQEGVLERLQPRATAESVITLLVAEGKISEFHAKALAGSAVIPFVLGPYVLEGWIAAGGMGNVFRATHQQMKRTVALKVLHGGASASPQHRRRFQREVELAARLQHPNVVAAFDAGEQDGVTYLVTEFVEGEDLGRLVKREGPLSPQRAVDLIVQAARGLQYAHSRGIIHRDVKPSNLILGRDGVVRLLDVGLALLVTGEDGAPGSVAPWMTNAGLTAAGSLMGTIDYVSPEQADNPRSVDPRSDVYSLGGTLYYLLTGRPPFDGSAMDRLRAHRESPPPSARAIRPEISATLDRLIQKMMAKRPDDRPPDVSAVLNHLQANPRGVSRRWVLLTGGIASVALGIYAVSWRNRKRAAIPPRIPFDAEAEQQRWAKIIGMPASMQNSLGMTMVLVPPGSFVAGTPDEVIQRELRRAIHPLQIECLRSEKQREARISRPFYVSATEVTIGQFRRFVEGSRPRFVTLAEMAMEDAQGGWGWNVREGWRRKVGCNWERADELPVSDDYPVSNVTWEEAVAFCRWLSSETNCLYRLPTEVEWEFACRAGNEGMWCFGDDESELVVHAWFQQTSLDQTHAVAQKRANHLGMFDVHGNVMEWCDAGEASDRPSEEVLGTTRDDHQPVRGGFFRSDADRTRCGARSWEHKNTLGPGFRVVRVLDVPSVDF